MTQKVFSSTRPKILAATRIQSVLLCSAEAAPARLQLLRPFPPRCRQLYTSRSFQDEAARLQQRFAPGNGGAHTEVDLAQLNDLLSSLTRPGKDEDAESRAERKQRFHTLLDVFHSVTVCTPTQQKETLADHFSSLDDESRREINFLSAPNVVLQGVASSMTEPSLESRQAAAAPSVTKDGAASAEPISESNPGKLVSAAALAKPFIDAITQQTESRVADNRRRPRLVGILATPSPPSIAYAEWTKKACESVGIEFDIWRTWDQAPGQEPPSEDEYKNLGGLEDDVEDLIIAANSDEKVDGIMVYFPVFGGRQDTYLSQIIKPSKDVEGLSFSFAWNLYHNVRWIAPSRLGGSPGSTAEGNVLSETEKKEVTQALQGKDGHHDHSLGNDEAVPAGLVKGILPCTPLGIVKCLEAMQVYDRSLPYGDRLRGKTITVVNRSEVVGRPLAALLANDGARVFSVDVDSIQEFSKRSHAVEGGNDEPQQEEERRGSAAVQAARKANASQRLRPHHIVRPCPHQDLATCLSHSQVIISGVPSPNYKVPTSQIQQGSICVNFSSEKNFEKDVRTKAALYLPSVGKMTCTMLQRNLLRLVEAKEMIEDGTGR